ncbi:MAG: hypothetical protein KKA73_18285 [Chloroflexi bacterium]|nr:hypothetical protein [Chloroflexota bacterium]MBU1749636.1 hypothetical protein [Chloroflexota bacterium]
MVTPITWQQMIALWLALGYDDPAICWLLDIDADELLLALAGCWPVKDHSLPAMATREGYLFMNSLCPGDKVDQS